MRLVNADHAPIYLMVTSDDLPEVRREGRRVRGCWVQRNLDAGTGRCPAGADLPRLADWAALLAQPGWGSAQEIQRKIPKPDERNAEPVIPGS